MPHRSRVSRLKRGGAADRGRVRPPPPPRPASGSPCDRERRMPGTSSCPAGVVLPVLHGRLRKSRASIAVMRVLRLSISVASDLAHASPNSFGKASIRSVSLSCWRRSSRCRCRRCASSAATASKSGRCPTATPRLSVRLWWIKRVTWRRRSRHPGPCLPRRQQPRESAEPVARIVAAPGETRSRGAHERGSSSANSAYFKGGHGR